MYTGEKIVKKIVEFLGMFMSKTLSVRIVSMLLIAIEVPNARITELTGLCDKSVRTLRKNLRKGEIESQFVVGGGGRPPVLKEIEETLIKEIERNEYHSAQEIADMIEEEHGLKVSLGTVRNLLKKNGIKRLKCGSLPSKADVVEQREFYEGTLKPLMERAKRNEIVLSFVDAAHFVMGCDFLGYIYGKTRRFVKTASGRKRYNVLGALNFVTKKMTTVVNDTYITSTEICLLLIELASEYAGKTIHLVLDNARYQKCALVQDTAHRLGIVLVYVPPYSPNLNLIERLWKFTKAKLRTKYYHDFDGFKQKINSILCNTDKEFLQDMSALISDKVQLFDDIVPPPVSSNISSAYSLYFLNSAA